jgi:hypothetical protein
MYYLHRAGETTGPYAPGRLGMMLDAGEITATDQVCEVGTEEWLPVEVVLPLSEPLAKATARVAEKVRLQPFFWLSVLLFFSGVAFALFFAKIIGVPFGVALILVAVALDRPRFLCGECGNRVEKSSVICPTCNARLVKRLAKKK